MILAAPGETPRTMPSVETSTIPRSLDPQRTAGSRSARPSEPRASAWKRADRPTRSTRRSGRTCSDATRVGVAFDTGGLPVTGVSCPVLPAPASSASWRRMGSSCASGGPPTAAITSSMAGQRSAGSLEIMRNTAVWSSSGQSGRDTEIGRGLVCTCACITSSEGPSNGGSPVSISYSTMPSEYWSEAAVISLD